MSPLSTDPVTTTEMRIRLLQMLSVVFAVNSATCVRAVTTVLDWPGNESTIHACTGTHIRRNTHIHADTDTNSHRLKHTQKHRHTGTDTQTLPPPPSTTHTLKDACTHTHTQTRTHIL